jgi:adenylate cyclase
VKLSLRAKTVVLFAATTLVPVAITVVLLIDANVGPVREAEETRQSAIANEVANEPYRILSGVQNDAVAVAAVLSRAAGGAIKDEDAIEAVRALLSTRENLYAVRFEVPSAHVSTVIRWKATDAVIPESTPELRALADQRGSAIAVTDLNSGLVVVPVMSAPGTNRPPGYITAKADLTDLAKILDDIAQRRFGGDGEVREVSLLIATHDRRMVASFGIPASTQGADVSSFPIWRMFPTAVYSGKRVSVTGRFADGDRPMVGAVQTLPDSGWVVATWRPEAIAYKPLADMRRRGLLVALGAAILALVVGALSARAVTAPILAIVAQVRLIARRKWRELSLGSTRGDELGELTRSLGEMSRDLEQGEVEARLRGDLSRFMSKQLVDAIVKGEHPLALGGKRTVVSVVFADVVGFTPLAEARDAEQIVALLNELFSVLTEIVFRHGGTVDKFVGDCIMAVWGAPVAQEDHARRALAAAEDMMRFLETANEGWKEKYDVEIRLGIGVNSGEALVGNIGSDKRMEYTVIGDVVNVAARLEAIAQPNQVLVSGATRELVGDAFSLQKLGDRRLTGRKTETAVFALDVD